MAVISRLASLFLGLSLGLVIAACMPTPVPDSSRDATGVASGTPMPLPSATAAELPSAGGTCSAAQFVTTSSPTPFPGFATLGYALVFVEQRMRNAGERCLLQLPDVIGLASGSGDFLPVPVRITTSPTSIDIAPGESISIVLGASWWLGVSTDTGATALPTPPCDGRISDVGRVEFPLASGSIEIAWGSPWIWRDVCMVPPSVTVTLDVYEPPPIVVTVTRSG